MKRRRKVETVMENCRERNRDNIRRIRRAGKEGKENKNIKKVVRRKR